jgi:outer membrane protein OmpA-like peptidoglycan-associated protein
MSAAPPPIAAAPPAVTTRALTVEETYRTSLAQQTQLPAAGTAGVPGVPDTLIISSEGLETVRREQSPTRPASAARPGQGVGAALRPGGLGVAPAQSSTVKVATILFADGSSRLDDEARHILGQVAKLHGEQGGTLRVVGHASMRTKPIDPERHAKVNEGVSIARANAVAGQLARLGVQRDTIVVTARGDSEPAYYEVMGTGEAGNRRAEIFLDRNP